MNEILPRQLYRLNYTREQYQAKGEVNSRVLHYLIALDQPDELICSTIEKYKAQRLFVRLSYADPANYRLTPLALAAICGRKEVAEKLIAAGVSLAAQDAFGYTPLHHAALRFDGMFETLIAKVKKSSLDTLRAIRCQFGGTYEDVRRMVFPPPLDSNKAVAVLEGMEISAEMFRAVIGVPFCDSVRATAQTLLQLHREALQPFQTMARFLQTTRLTQVQPKQMRVFETSPPKIGIKHQSLLGWGVQALEEIPFNQVVCLYDGRYFTEETRSKNLDTGKYSTNMEDASEERSLASLINAGPPNCAFVSYKTYQGLPNRTCVVTMRPIASGEFLYVSYGGNHRAMVGKHIILQEKMEELREYFKNKSLALSNLEKMVSGKKLQFKAVVNYDEGLVIYVWSAPSVFLQLHLEGILKTDQTLQLLEKPWMKLWMEHVCMQFSEAYDHMLRFVQQLRKDDPAGAQKLVAMIPSMSARAFGCAITLMGAHFESKKKITVTDEMQRSYTDFGILFDHLHEIYDTAPFEGVLTQDEKKGEDRAFELGKYQSLPPDLQSEIKNIAKELLEMMQKEAPEKAHLLLNIVRSLS